MTEPIHAYPQGMTAAKLRLIAGWMDTLDALLDAIKLPDDPTWKERLEVARGLQPRNEIQRDLYAWANEIAATSDNEV